MSIVFVCFALKFCLFHFKWFSSFVDVSSFSFSLVLHSFIPELFFALLTFKARKQCFLKAAIDLRFFPLQCLQIKSVTVFLILSRLLQVVCAGLPEIGYSFSFLFQSFAVKCCGCTLIFLPFSYLTTLLNCDQTREKESSFGFWSNFKSSCFFCFESCCEFVVSVMSVCVCGKI